MAEISYTDEQQAAFCSLAQEIGIGRAIRELGYPKSHASGIKWLNARGLKPNLDKIMQQTKLWHTFYDTQDLLEQIDEAMAVCQEMVSKVNSADDMKKLAEAMQKLVNTRLLLEGKSTQISEKRETTQADLEIAELMRMQAAKNKEKIESV